MKYVDWVERVLRATVEAFDEGDGFSVSIQAVLDELDVGLEERAVPLHDALRDLERLGLVESDSGWYVKINHEARKIRVAPLRTTWPQGPRRRRAGSTRRTAGAR